MYQQHNVFHRILLSLLILCLALAPNMCAANTERPHIIPPHAVWKYRTNATPPPKDWTRLEFDDVHWSEGPAGFGYGDGDDRTVLDSMRGQYDSVQIRYRFTVPQPGLVQKLLLYIRYDDGFIAYLNGREMARAGVTWRNNRRIVADHEAKSFKLFEIHQPEALLHPGHNVLAIQGFNRSLNSSDFSLDPMLTTHKIPNPGIPHMLSRKEYLADLDALEHRLNDQASYLRLRGYDFREAFTRLRKLRRSSIATTQFALSLKRLIAQLGDAHAKVVAQVDASSSRFLPFSLADTRDGLVALQANHSGFFDNTYPFLVALDGRAMSSWIKAASEYVSQASPQFIRYRGLREMRRIDQLRHHLDIPPSEFIHLTLTSRNGKKRITKRLPLSHEKLPHGTIPIGSTRILENNIGYLRISSMKNSRIQKVISAMNEFTHTDGLIIDVRNNTGGRYGILQALYGFFLPPSAPPYVTNIAAYRLSHRFAEDHLYYRPTYPLNYRSWTMAKRQAIQHAIEGFQPKWPLPSNQFSPWHFMVLDHSKSPRQYFYRKPVVVLCNVASFSATDGFLSAFADLPQVTIIGQPSSGGSGATQKFTLPHSGIRIALSSMASFRPNGMLYDGNGIDVDIRISPAPSDFLGKTDAVLKRAIARIMQTP